MLWSKQWPSALYPIAYGIVFWKNQLSNRGSYEKTRQLLLPATPIFFERKGKDNEVPGQRLTDTRMSMSWMLEKVMV